MSARDWVAGGLLFAGVGIQVLACVNLLVARTVYDRLHLVAPAAVLGGPLVCAGVLANESFSVGGIHAILVAAVLIATGPVLTHATARGTRLRETRGLVVLPSEEEQR